jgi:hypothetical protein
MKAAFARPGGNDDLSITIANTGGKFDNVNLPGGLTHLPYTGSYTIDWDEPESGVEPEIVENAGLDEQTTAAHTYTSPVRSRWIHIQGDSRINRRVLVGT